MCVFTVGVVQSDTGVKIITVNGVQCGSLITYLLTTITENTTFLLRHSYGQLFLHNMMNDASHMLAIITIWSLPSLLLHFFNVVDLISTSMSHSVCHTCDVNPGIVPSSLSLFALLRLLHSTECDFKHHETIQVPDHRVLVVNISLTAAVVTNSQSTLVLVLTLSATHRSVAEQPLNTVLKTKKKTQFQVLPKKVLSQNTLFSTFFDIKTTVYFSADTWSVAY